MLKDFNIFCHNKNEWIKIQELLFDIGYIWCGDDKPEIYLFEDMTYPLILADNMGKYDKTMRISFLEMRNDENWKQHLNKNNYNAIQLIRKLKLDKINGTLQ